MKIGRDIAGVIALVSTTALSAETGLHLKLSKELAFKPARSMADPHIRLVSLMSDGYAIDAEGLTSGGSDGGGGTPTPTPTPTGSPTTTPATQVNPLSSFNTSTTNGSSLVTAHIATAYAPTFRDPQGMSSRPEKKDASTGDKRKLNFWNALGVDISASLPAQSATLRDYGKQALLTLDGGAINIYGAFAGRDEKKDEPIPDARMLAFDHVYLFDAGADQMLMYVKQGIGGRAVKTALEGNGYAGVGTAYLGFGVDGPLLTTRGGASDSTSGWITLEGYATANVLNPSTLNKLFNADTKTHSLPTASARFKIGLPGRFYLSAEYSKAFGSYGKKLGDVAMISFGYNTETKASTTTTTRTPEGTTTVTKTAPNR